MGLEIGTQFGSCRPAYDGVDEILDSCRGVLLDSAADRLWILKVARDEAPQVDGIADAKEDISLGQLAWPAGHVDLALQLENHLRQPLLRRIKVTRSLNSARRSGSGLTR